MEEECAMNKPRILIVDDEPSFIRLLKLVLENTGRYSVRKEDDATKALEVAREFQPDLILLDFVMPKVDGVSAAQAIRADPRFSHTPILFLSATVVENNGFAAQIAGFPAFSKPIGVTQLMHVIDESLIAAA
jgi:two-component system alkaline phosphatase synthesis response regulator PhoP